MRDSSDGDKAVRVAAPNAAVRMVCSEAHRPAMRFRFQARGGGQVEKCLRHGLIHRQLVRTALLTALVVGTILTAINQGNFIVAGDFKPELLWKIPLTYCVPYSVVTWSSLRTALVR